MGYYAGTIYVDINLPKENFAKVEERFQELMDSPRFADGNGQTWRQYKYGVPKSTMSPPTGWKLADEVEPDIAYYEKESKTFVLDDIFNSFGFEYDEHSRTGAITEIRYPDTSYDHNSVEAFINLLAGLVDEGDYIEWLGSEGDEDRWMFYHHNGRWSIHQGQVEILYPSKEKMLEGNDEFVKYLT